MMIRCSIFTFLASAALITTSCRRDIPVPISGIPADTNTIQSQIAQSRQPLTLVHIWATWCQPCREEFPELVKIHSQYAHQGLALLLVSADDPEDPGTVTTFLAEFESPVGSLIATELNQNLIESLSPTWSGALPASFFFGADGTLLAEWEGKKSYEHYAETIETLLKQTKGDTP